MTAMFRIAFLVALSITAACGKDDKSSAGGTGAPPAGRDALIAGWKSAGLTVSAFTADKSGAIGGDCTAGTLNGIDAVVCVFANDQEAKAAESKALAWIGATTGSALVNGKLVMAVADRNKADPTGRTIDTATKVFRGRK
jgi:hypothetical protein